MAATGTAGGKPDAGNLPDEARLDLAAALGKRFHLEVEAAGGNPTDTLDVLAHIAALNVYSLAVDGHELAAASSFSKLVIGRVGTCMGQDAPAKGTKLQ